MKGPNANAPTRGTKGRSAAWIPVDDELDPWIGWRLAEVAKEEMLRERIVLFPNPTARNRERRWIANTLCEERNQAAAKVGLALVDVIRPRTRRMMDPMWIQPNSGLTTPSIGKEKWRGGRDSNPQLPA